MTAKLGKLTKVDLRELWNGEATDFTPWLAKESNIKILGDTINLELEVQDQEKNVGPFRADILCKDTSSDHYVLIENQLERTDHTHLGQLLTYAAGLDAVTIIWISKSFTEEHRAALDWLNRITEEDINFFGIQVEAYKIGDSLPAPMFKLISKPNDWSKTVRRTVDSSKVTPTKLMQLNYWEKLKQYLEDSNSFIKSHSPRPQHWTNFSVGRSNFYLSATVNTRDKFIRIEFICEGPEAKNNFNVLKSKYENEFNGLFDADVIWDELPNAKITSINIKNYVDVFDENDWPKQHEWLKENLEKFSKFFRTKIKSL